MTLLHVIMHFIWKTVQDIHFEKSLEVIFFRTFSYSKYKLRKRNDTQQYVVWVPSTKIIYFKFLLWPQLTCSWKLFASFLREWFQTDKLSKRYNVSYGNAANGVEASLRGGHPWVIFLKKNHNLLTAKTSYRDSIVLVRAKSSSWPSTMFLQAIITDRLQSFWNRRTIILFIEVPVRHPMIPRHPV